MPTTATTCYHNRKLNGFFLPGRVEMKDEWQDSTGSFPLLCSLGLASSTGTPMARNQQWWFQGKKIKYYPVITSLLDECVDPQSGIFWRSEQLPSPSGIAFEPKLSFLAENGYWIRLSHLMQFDFTERSIRLFQHSLKFLDLFDRRFPCRKNLDTLTNGILVCTKSPTMEKRRSQAYSLQGTIFANWL